MTHVAILSVVCDRCGEVVLEDLDGDWYSDPVISPPTGWEIVYAPNGNDSEDVCPGCQREQVG